jgi:16S rRNA C1402 N4-methylase RsmH
MLNLKAFLENVPDSMDFSSHKNSGNESGINSLLLIITFHSLEERMVTTAMAQWKRKKLGTQATRKFPILPSEEEISENSRSGSAKLYGFMFGPQMQL